MMARWLPSMLHAAAPLPSELPRLMAEAAAACKPLTSADFSCKAPCAYMSTLIHRLFFEADLH